jgi:predicted DsbA family dithiol-disulfide isomerase
MRVDVISDVVCPWCWVGKRKLELALAERPALAPRVTLQPFELDPGVPAEGEPYRARLARKFGGLQAVERAWERLRAIGAQVGLTFAFDRIEVAQNTLDAHRVLTWALDEGSPEVQWQLGERLFAAHFEHGERIDRPAVLAAHAQAVGLDGDAIAARLATDADQARVREAIAGAQRMGVTGVPTFVFAGRLAVSGAQDPSVLVGAMDRAQAG